MANELQASALTPGATYYAVVRDGAGLYWYDTGGAFEAYNAAHWAAYAVNPEAANTAGDWVGDFPAAIAAAGMYAVGLRQRAGSTPAVTDPGAGTGEIRWSGTAEVEDAADYPVTIARLKAHLRLDVVEQDDYLTGLIAAATDHAEQAMSCTLTARDRTVALYEDRDNPAGHPLPYGPLIAVQRVTDAGGDPVDAGGYVLTRAGLTDRVRFTGTVAYPVTVVYRAGYATAAAVPAAVRQAILMHVATLYENRESVSEKGRVPVPHTLEAFYGSRARTTGVG